MKLVGSQDSGVSEVGRYVFDQRINHLVRLPQPHHFLLRPRLHLLPARRFLDLLKMSMYCIDIKYKNDRSIGIPRCYILKLDMGNENEKMKKIRALSIKETVKMRWILRRSNEWILSQKKH